MLTVLFGVSQLLWADPVPGGGEEESFVPAADATLPFLPCGKFTRQEYSPILDDV